MSTLTEMREALEQLEQDGARFRWVANNPLAAECILTVICGHVDPENRADVLRARIDDARRFSETPELTKAQMEYGCRAAIDAFLKVDPADAIDTHSRLGPFKHG